MIMRFGDATLYSFGMAVFVFLIVCIMLSMGGTEPIEFFVKMVMEAM